jgi:hypothetical protein
MAEIDAGRPIIGAFTQSPWGSHAATVIGYDTTGGKQIMIVRPNLFNKKDVELTWGVGYSGFGIVTIIPQDLPDLNNVAALRNTSVITAEPVAPAAFELIVNDSDRQRDRLWWRGAFSSDHRSDQPWPTKRHRFSVVVTGTAF